jgi:hypothetical protein
MIPRFEIRVDIKELGHVLIDCEDIIEGLLWMLFALQFPGEEISVAVEQG